MDKLKLILILLYSSNIFASEALIKPKAGLTFQAAIGKNNGNSEQRKLTSLKKDLAFNSSAYVSFEYQNIFKDLFEYGAKLGLETTSKNSRKVSSSIFLISDYGKLELGSDQSAYSKMKITHYSIACGSAGGWDSWTELSSDPKKSSYISNSGNFLDGKSRDSTKSEYSRKISYFTPKMQGFELGISYIPDSSNTGYAPTSDKNYHKFAKPYPYVFGIKDGIAYGIGYENEIDDNTKFKSALVGENGKVKAFEEDDKKPANYKFSNLSTYSIGSELHINEFAIAASYMNYMKSITSPEIDINGRNSFTYGVGARYKPNPFAISLNYFRGNYKNNKSEAISLATDFKIVQGLLTYAEFTHYKAKGKLIDEKTNIKFEKIRGNIFILGVKIEI